MRTEYMRPGWSSSTPLSVNHFTAPWLLATRAAARWDLGGTAAVSRMPHAGTWQPPVLRMVVPVARGSP